MTIRERIEEEQRLLEEEEKEQSLSSLPVVKRDLEIETTGEELTAPAVAEEFITKGIPNLIKGAAAVPLSIAKFIHSPSTYAEEMSESVSDYAYDRWMNPSHALPEVGMIAGGALGAMVGLPNVGAAAGTFVGTQLRNEITGKPWTKEDVTSVMVAPLGNVPFAAAGAANRLVRGTAKQTTAAETIYKSARLTPEQIAMADDILDEAEALTTAKRELVNFTTPNRILAKHVTRTEQGVKPTVSEMEQLEMFIQPDQMKQKALFDVNDIAPKQTVRKPANVSSAESSRQSGNRFRQPELLNDPQKMKQLHLLKEEVVANPKPNVSTVTPKPVSDQPSLPFYRKTEIEEGGEHVGTQLRSIKDDKLKQESLFPKKEKLDQHWLTAHRREKRRQQLVTAARHRVANHVAETEARMRAGKAIKDDPALAALYEDERNLARISVLQPEHLQPDKNPFVKEIRKAGMAASFANPHSTLAYKLGPEGNHISQQIMEANDLHVTGVHRLRERAHAVMDKHDVQEHDLKTHGMLQVLFEHNDLRDRIRAEGIAGIRNWETETGNKINVKQQDYARLAQMGQFADELKQQVLDPMWAFSMKRNADPDTMAQYNMRYMLPTFTSRRVATEIKSDLQAIEKALGSLSEVERGELHGKMLQQQHEALSNKLAVSSKYADQADKSRAAASQTLYKQGMKPGEVFNSAYKDKHTDMMFGTGMRASMDDYISGFMKKAVYDPVMSRTNEVIKQANWDPSTKRWVTAFALDQLGTRRQVQTTRLNEFMKRVPIIGKHITEDSTERAVNTIGQFNAAVNLGLNPRFYPVNGMQTLVMGYGLVGADGLAHGLMKMVTDWPNSYKEAVQNGAVQSGLEHMWKELGTNSRGHAVTRFLPEVLNKANSLLVASEAFNRTLMYQAGKFIANKEGLTGRTAVRRARDINRMANHGYSSAERITASGTLAGSTLLRYKSFGLQTVSYIKHLIVHNPKAAAETLAMTLALGGTAGIPAFGMVQDGLAKHFNYNMPNLTPLDEITGSDMSASFSPWPAIPGVSEPMSVENIIGALLGPAAGAAVDLHEEGPGPAAARLIRGYSGAGPTRPISAIDEYMRGGVTTSASGQPLIQRSTADILKSAAGFKTTPKAEAYKHRRDIQRAYDTGDMTGLDEALKSARKAGVIDPGKMLSTARRLKTTDEKKKGMLDALLGR